MRSGVLYLSKNLFLVTPATNTDIWINIHFFFQPEKGLNTHKSLRKINTLFLKSSIDAFVKSPVCPLLSFPRKRLCHNSTRRSFRTNGVKRSARPSPAQAGLRRVEDPLSRKRESSIRFLDSPSTLLRVVSLSNHGSSPATRVLAGMTKDEAYCRCGLPQMRHTADAA